MPKRKPYQKKPRVYFSRLFKKAIKTSTLAGTRVDQSFGVVNQQ